MSFTGGGRCFISCFIGGELQRSQQSRLESSTLVYLSPYSFGLSGTSQQYFFLRTNQAPDTINQPTVLFSQNKSVPVHQASATSQTNRPSVSVSLSYQRAEEAFTTLQKDPISISLCLHTFLCKPKPPCIFYSPMKIS
jgi:hypothetical protein